ncbi:hypothetical protein D3C81_1531310 [compost metagenome]
MLAIGVDRITPVGEHWPHAVGEKLVLGDIGPVVITLAVLAMGAEHFLQKHHVGRQRAHGIAQLGQHETPVQRAEALVCVDRQYLQRSHFRRLIAERVRLKPWLCHPLVPG